jgi:hypothetical protein
VVCDSMVDATARANKCWLVEQNRKKAVQSIRCEAIAGAIREVALFWQRALKALQYRRVSISTRVEVFRAKELRSTQNDRDAYENNDNPLQSGTPPLRSFGMNTVDSI